MATKNVCRYNKFGHCKFSEKVKFMHNIERCENSSCAITNCNLRHPRTCNFYRDYQRCKFGEWCSFNHNLNSNNGSQESINIIFERIESISKIIAEKDEMIKELAEKIDNLEKQNKQNEETESTEKVLEERECDMNTLFVNP